MDLPKVIIKDRYSDFLNGKEVEATVASGKDTIAKGMHVMGFHDSIAIHTAFTVPRERQSQYIGIEGMVTAVAPAADGTSLHIRVVKV